MLHSVANLLTGRAMGLAGLRCSGIRQHLDRMGLSVCATGRCHTPSWGAKASSRCSLQRQEWGGPK
jgi:hypothetical protein